MQSYHLLVFVLSVLVFTNACSSQQQTQATVQIPTLMLLPSETPVPSLTLTNTATLTPSQTPRPTFTPTPLCDPEAWWESVEELVAEFFDTAEVATQTARGSLSTVQLELRRIYREFDRADYPSCVSDIYFDIRAGMDDLSEAIGNFASQNDSLVDFYFQKANENLFSAYIGLREAEVYTLEFRLQAPWLVWGGDRVEVATLTAVVIENATFQVELMVTLNFLSTPSATPIPSVTPASSVIGRSSGFVRADLREGPGEEFALMGDIPVRTNLAVMGRNDSGDWLNVQLPDGREGWVEARFVSLDD